MLDLAPGDPQLRHIDRAWASTVHAFQGRTVDTVIAAMEANHPNLTTQKTLYVEISRARDRAELVTDDKAALRGHRGHRHPPALRRCGGARLLGLVSEAHPHLEAPLPVRLRGGGPCRAAGVARGGALSGDGLGVSLGAVTARGHPAP